MNRAAARTHFYRRAHGSKFAPLNKEYRFLEFRNFTAKVRKMSVDFLGEVWYCGVLRKEADKHGSKETAHEWKSL